MKFSKPNLPQGAACLCVVSGGNKQVIRALEQRGVTCYITRPSRALSAPVASHADMLARSFKPGALILAADQRELHARGRHVALHPPRGLVKAARRDDPAEDRRKDLRLGLGEGR